MRFRIHCALALVGAITAPLASAGRPPRAASSTTQPAERGDGSGRKGAEHLPDISVDLLGPLSSLKGATWPREYDWIHKKPDQPALMMTLDRPHEMVIHLPGGRTLRHESKLTFLTYDPGRGTIATVKLVPNMRELPFQDAISELERILKEWDAELMDVAKPRVAEWRKYGNLDPKGMLSHPGGATIHGEKKAYIFFEIRPADEGWFVSMTLGQAT